MEAEKEKYSTTFCLCVCMSHSAYNFNPCRIWLRKKQEAAVQTFWVSALFLQTFFTNTINSEKNISLLDSVYSAERV